MKALTPAHVEKGRLHHPCGSLRQLTAGWVKVGLQRRCLTPCCAALPAPPLTALVAGRLGGWPLAAVSAALFSLSTWDGRQHSAAGQTQVTWRLLPSQRAAISWPPAAFMLVWNAGLLTIPNTMEVN